MLKVLILLLIQTTTLGAVKMGNDHSVQQTMSSGSLDTPHRKQNGNHGGAQRHRTAHHSHHQSKDWPKGQERKSVHQHKHHPHYPQPMDDDARVRTLHKVRGGAVNGNSGSRRVDERETEHQKRPKVLVVDVDGTLYGKDAGIEQQIVSRIKSHCSMAFNVSGEECDELHHSHGSTIAGLRKTLRLSDEEVRSFYRFVYEGLDLSSLLPSTTTATDSSGYRHHVPYAPLLSSFDGPVYIASNSPLSHVKRVLSCLGLANFNWAGILTPDSIPQLPTKTEPGFWKPLLNAHPPEEYTLLLLDDSQNNLRYAEKLGMRGIRVSDHVPFERAVAAAMGAVPMQDEWVFDDAGYLAAKNAVDAASMSRSVAQRLERELRAMRLPERSSPLRVVDMGAGLLSMLEPTLGMAHRTGWASVHYVAYETNRHLLRDVRQALLNRGFKEDPASKALRLSGGSNSPNVTVELRVEDFMKELRTDRAHVERSKPDLLIGCCLADLYQPEAFTAVVHKLATPRGSPLVYLPITFAGRTITQPSHSEDTARDIPSDDLVFSAYHQSLEEIQGHCLDPEKLVQRMEAHGASLLAQASSDWHIKATGPQKYLWECLLYFFGMGVLPKLGPQGWDVAAWKQRMLATKPDLQVSNVDLLFRFNADANNPAKHLPVRAYESGDYVASREASSASLNGTSRNGTYTSAAFYLPRKSTYVEFAGPRHVRALDEPWPVDVELARKDIEIQAVCSLISSGTELKVYRGDFDSDSALDVTIKGMEERMAYPMRYGYSLVGRVVRCGRDVPDPDRLLGRMVFCFAPHASRAVVDYTAAMLVPLGVEPADAVYLPSVETALSLVQDAAPIVGERMCVVGCGLIGLLVCAVASRMPLEELRAVDPLPARRALALRIGASAAVDPPAALKRVAVDTSVEVSGVPAGLQTAIDCTGYGGKVVIGSWYGSKPAPLRLGLDFHRSHLRLLVSQVSRISTQLQDRWTKKRRFDTAWDVLRQLRPSRLLTTRVIPPSAVAEGFKALDQDAANTLAVVIDYGTGLSNSAFAFSRVHARREERGVVRRERSGSVSAGANGRQFFGNGEVYKNGIARSGSVHTTSRGFAGPSITPPVANGPATLVPRANGQASHHGVDSDGDDSHLDDELEHGAHDDESTEGDEHTEQGSHHHDDHEAHEEEKHHEDHKE